jgi:sugar/nucleoside kinase (ribokinase family)
VLRQVERPEFVACDTMNFWIESRRPELLDLLKHVDMVTVNEGEARQLSEKYNLVKAARWIMERGPKVVVIKKGENGAYLFREREIFFAPAYPLEEVFDPTGAGDSFAGGLMGYLARTETSDPAALRRAVIYGSALGSFAVERFSVERLLAIGPNDIAARVGAFRQLVAFEEELPA